MSKISWSRDPTEKRHVHKFTFTFTFIRHHGKTHNHRPRGDTTWRAQTDTHKKTTSKGTDTKGAGVSRQRRARESGGEPSSSSQTLPAFVIAARGIERRRVSRQGVR